MNGHSSTLIHLGFPQVAITVQECAVPKLKVQESPATFSRVRVAVTMRFEKAPHVAWFDQLAFLCAAVQKHGGEIVEQLIP